MFAFLLQALWRRPEGLAAGAPARVLALAADALAPGSRVAPATQTGVIAPGLRRYAASLTGAERVALAGQLGALPAAHQAALAPLL